MKSDLMRDEYLEAMGIELWHSKAVLREAAMKVVASEPSLQTETSADPVVPAVPAVTASNEVTDVADSSPENSIAASTSTISNFNLRLLQYPACLMIIDIEESMDTIPESCQRLLDGIALAIGAENRHRKVIGQKWTAASVGDPYQVVHRHVGQLIGPGNSALVVMGQIPRKLLFGNQPEGMMISNFLGRTALATPGIEVLLNSPMLKRDLWLSIQDSRSG